jgi:hypothetical protein
MPDMFRLFAKEIKKDVMTGLRSGGLVIMPPYGGH